MSVASKNLFDLLGNDAEGESDRPAAPVKTVEKTSTHTAKRNADGAAPVKPAPTGNRRGGGVGGNEAAFRDRNAGSDRNRGKPTEEGGRGSGRGGYNARVRGGRGGRHPRTSDDRHSKSLPTGGSEKQAAQGWGATEGEAELKDEQAGEEIAKTEQKQAEGEAAEEVKEEEEEDKHITYDQYLAQIAEKKLALESEASLAIRQANEGANDKKWAGAKPLVKDEDEDYFAGTGGKSKRERERKVKNLVEIENRYIEPERTGGRGGRGGPRGGRGDGGRGRGRGAPRGEFRGGRGAAPRSSENRAPVNTSDESAFPSLGSK